MSRKTGPHIQMRPESKGRWNTMFLAFAFTLAVHVIVIGAFLFWPRPEGLPVQAETTSQAIEISFVNLAKPPGPANEADTAASATFVRPAPPQPIVAPPPVIIATGLPTPDTSDIVSDADLVGVAGVGQGGGGGGLCDMGRLVQEDLRRDPSVHAAVRDADRVGKAILLWNGDWVQLRHQEGKGLAIVREAIMWRVAFAPEDCRNRPIHGRIVLSLEDGGTRFVVGDDSWRWLDLLGVVPPVR